MPMSQLIKAYVDQMGPQVGEAEHYWLACNKPGIALSCFADPFAASRGCSVDYAVDVGFKRSRQQLYHAPADGKSYIMKRIDHLSNFMIWSCTT